jgi:hypothetical protein
LNEKSREAMIPGLESGGMSVNSLAQALPTLESGERADEVNADAPVFFEEVLDSPAAAIENNVNGEEGQLAGESISKGAESKDGKDGEKAGSEKAGSEKAGSAGSGAALQISLPEGSQSTATGGETTDNSSRMDSNTSEGEEISGSEAETTETTEKSGGEDEAEAALKQRKRQKVKIDRLTQVFETPEKEVFEQSKPVDQDLHHFYEFEQQLKAGITPTIKPKSPPATEGCGAGFTSILWHKINQTIQNGP